MRRGRRRPWVLVGLWAAGLLVATSVPDTCLPEPFPGSDKLAHVLMYAGLGLLLANALHREHCSRSFLLLFLMSVGMCGGFALFDEWHQRFCQRHPDPMDWLADVTGAAIGAGALIAARRRKRRGDDMSEARKISGDELNAELDKAEPCVVEFWMVGCPACARFAPTFGELSQEYSGRANLVALEARENMEASRQYAIRGVPTVIVFRAGQEVQRTTGAKTLAEMREWLDPVLD